MPLRRHVELLLAKADEDLSVLDILMQHPGAPVTALGFHAQQAVEKLLKAALKVTGGDYPLTHNIRVLLELLEDAGCRVPAVFWDATVLTPFAANFRYDALPDEGGAELDAQHIRELISELRGWVSALLEA